MACPHTEYALDMDVENMCRICLSQTDASERLFHIFSSAIVDGFLVAIPDVLQFCVNLTVSKSDGKPCKICQKCKSQLLEFYLFKQKCQRTDKVLQEALGSPIKQNDSDLLLASLRSPSVSDDNIMVEILESSTNCEDTALDEPNTIGMPEQTENQCHLCDQIFQTEKDLQDHAVVHCSMISDQDQESFIDDGHYPEYDETEVDDKSTVAGTHNGDETSVETEHSAIVNEEDAYYIADDLKMQRHMSVEKLLNDQSKDTSVDPSHEEQDDESIATIVAENDEPVEVKSIQSQNDITSCTEKSLEVHLRCNICGKTVKGRSRYFKHLRTHDVSTNVTEFLNYHICSICLQVFLHESEYTDHLKSADHYHQTDSLPLNGEEASYICGVCSAKYSRIDYVKQHLLSHLRSFPCPFAGCGCEYTSSARLGLHISSKHIEYETHQCQHCGEKSFVSKAELQQHLRVECNGKKYHCDHCDKKFLSSRSLAHHLKCLEKKHRCGECGKTFAQHGELKLHERMHNGERPFKCTICGKTYKTASLRTAHMDSHIDGKTFQCQICGKQLQTRTCYRNHIKRHSEERKHECDVCSKMFYAKYNVKIHKQKVHKLTQGVNQEKLDKL
ncbi:AAEL006453-PA [Aedes aegypti]|uniref:AAEL006453-PA n=1 Tax=Aedes aegypti TaxID=7159 RepID=Q176A5_AEDAE|nr:AAEL006453-PA [Aedes aegypti]